MLKVRSDMKSGVVVLSASGPIRKTGGKGGGCCPSGPIRKARGGGGEGCPIQARYEKRRGGGGGGGLYASARSLLPFDVLNYYFFLYITRSIG